MGQVIRVGIAGQGRSGFNIHARWLREAPGQFKIVAVADELPDRRKQAADEFGCRTYKTWQELLRDGQFDLLVNSLPSNLHPKASLAGLKAGYNVVSEKPAAVRVSDFDKVVAASKKARRTYAVFQNSRFYPFFQKVQEIIASGVIGQVAHVTSTWGGYARRWDWQTLQEHWGGNLNNTGPHGLDQSVILFGDKTPTVFARMWSGPNTLGDADDFAKVTLYGKGSPVVELLLSSYLAYPPGEIMTVSGTLGGITGGPKQLRWKFYDPKEAPKLAMWKPWSKDRNYCGEKLPWQEETWTLPAETDDFQCNSRAFYNNLYDVLANRGKLTVTLEQVRRQIYVLEECHRQNPLPKLAKKKIKA